MPKIVENKLSIVRENANHNPVKPGLSRYHDDYHDFPYGERVRLEHCLSLLDIRVLDFLSQKRTSNITDVQKKFTSKKLNLDNLVSRGLVQKTGTKFSLTQKGESDLEAILLWQKIAE